MAVRGPYSVARGDLVMPEGKRRRISVSSSKTRAAGPNYGWAAPRRWNSAWRSSMTRARASAAPSTSPRPAGRCSTSPCRGAPTPAASWCRNGSSPRASSPSVRPTAPRSSGGWPPRSPSRTPSTGTARSPSARSPSTRRAALPARPGGRAAPPGADRDLSVRPLRPGRREGADRLRRAPAADARPAARGRRVAARGAGAAARHLLGSLRAVRVRAAAGRAAGALHRR